MFIMFINEQDINTFIEKFISEKEFCKKKDKIIYKAVCYVTGYVQMSPEKLYTKINHFCDHDEYKRFLENVYYVTKNRSYDFLLNYPKSIKKELISYLKNNVEEVAILSSFVKIQYENIIDFNTIDETVIKAIQRSTNELENADIDTIADYLDDMNEEAVDGFVSNVKGILHEMKFTEFENLDGDNIFAKLFENTNHPDTDVSLIDLITENVTEAQLKATDSINYAKEYLEENPCKILMVTEELADKNSLESTGISNEELTRQVRETVESISNKGKSIWQYFPPITILSILILIFLLWKKYKNHKITKKEFYQKSMKLSGLKISKIILISFMLSIPGLNFATAIVLIVRQISFVDNILETKNAYQ